MASRKLWERALSFCLALLMIMTMMPASLLVPTDAASTTRLIYLNAGGSGLWDQAGAWFAAWVNSQWYTGNKVTGSIYVFEIPASATTLNFVRMSGGVNTPSWESGKGFWNQTSDLTISSSYNCYTITGWGGSDGYWSTYTPASYYVAGTAALCGNAWQAGDSKNKMSIQGNGTYSITYTDVPAGSHEFKITVGSWDTSYGKYNSSDTDISASGDNCKITLDAVSNVTITFNPNANSNSMITVDIVKVQATSYSVTWNATNVEISGASSVDEGEAYNATLEAASGYNLPDTITVKVGGNTITGYTYSNGNLTIPANLINGNIEIIAEAEKVTTETAYYVVGTAALCGKDWEATEANKMTKNSDGTYSITYKNVPAASNGTYKMKVTDNIGNYWGGDNNSDYWILVDVLSDVTITFDPSNGQISYSKTPVSGGMSDEFFYVDTDLVDYLNDNRVNSGLANGYSNDNQGLYNDADGGNSMYAYINHVISSQGYSYPLYFGPLAMKHLRYGWKGSKTDLNNWNSAANVAMRYYIEATGSYGDIFDASIQGLVGQTLLNGNLTDPNDSTKELVYFKKDAAAGSDTEWIAEGSGNPIMAYYADLKFPFKMQYNEDTRVTTYSYNSASDYAVFYDYVNPVLTTLSSGIPNYTANTGNGFYPLNRAADRDDAINNGFGMKLTLQFTVSKNGKIKVIDSNGDAVETDVVFKFTGDDDVWVFIDNQLVLDMGGAHAKSSGEINFANLNATVEKAYQITDSFTSWDSGELERAQMPYNTFGPDNKGIVTPFPEALATAFTNEYNTGISQVHTLTMFYMERGMFDSNMSIEFNMSPLPTGLTVSKDIENVNPGLNAAVQDDDEFSFDVDATLNGDTVDFDDYDLTDHGSISTNMSATNNLITGVRGDRYAHNFMSGSIEAFTAGTSFVITEQSYDSNKYSGTRWVVYKYGDTGYEVFKTGSDMSAEFKMSDDTTATYAVNFINAMKTGTLTLSKTYQDELISSDDFEFVFEIRLNLNNQGFELYPGLTYDVYNGTSLMTENVVSEDGTVKLMAGQTAKIKGIPIGTKYEIVERDASDLWQIHSSNGTSGTMTEAGANASFVNMTTTNAMAGKVIYVEAGTRTEYSIADVAVSGIHSDTEGLAVLNQGGIIVKAPAANQRYTFTYVGIHNDGRYVSGAVTVYTYSALDKSYVFDFGLSSNLEDISAGSGLFEDSILFNKYADGTTAQLWSIVFDADEFDPDEQTPETKISYTVGAMINREDRTSDDVIFTPVAFMTRVETYNYTIRIVAPGAEFEKNNPETGCVVTGEIRVMPANSVYYEDNFNVSDSETKDPAKEIVFGGNAEGQSSAPTIMQSNGQNGNYGYDSIYANGGFLYSNGNAAQLTDDGVNTQYAYFTFTGTGFDIISTTTQTTGGMAVYVFRGVHDSAYLDFILDLDAPVDPKDELPDPVDMVFVDTYYNDGRLYQIPVASVRLNGATDTYTVYIQALSTSAVKNTVSLDAVRIYNPMTAGNCTDYNATEINAQVKELRVLYGIDKIASLAGWNRSYGFFVGNGKGLSIIESMAVQECITSADLDEIYKSGPNNEMYLPYHMGIHFNYTVNSSDGFTFQIGAKAITDLNTAKKFSVNVRKAGTGAYVKVAEFELNTATDLYYDLTSYLKDYDTVGTNYDIIILNESPDANMEFVSLTTVKYSGITLS